MSFIFSLYHTFDATSIKSLTTKQKDECIKLLNNINGSKKENLVLLIMYHEHIKKGTSLKQFHEGSVPYLGKSENKMLSFDFNEFPQELQVIIYKYMLLKI